MQLKKQAVSQSLSQSASLRKTGRQVVKYNYKVAGNKGTGKKGTLTKYGNRTTTSRTSSGVPTSKMHLRSFHGEFQ